MPSIEGCCGRPEQSGGDTKGITMVRKRNNHEIEALDQALLAEVITLEAVINILDRKGIFNRQDLLEEIKNVHATLEHPEKKN